jgi:hypothetical protein
MFRYDLSTVWMGYFGDYTKIKAIMYLLCKTSYETWTSNSELFDNCDYIWPPNVIKVGTVQELKDLPEGRHVVHISNNKSYEESEEIVNWLLEKPSITVGKLALTVKDPEIEWKVIELMKEHYGYSYLDIISRIKFSVLTKANQLSKNK